MKFRSALLLIAMMASAVQLPSAHAESPLTLAYQGPLSGPESVIGQMQLRAVQFALKEFATKYPSAPAINLIQIDDQGDPAIATPLAAKSAANTGLLGIIGPAYSGAARVSIPTWSAASLAVVSPSATNPALSTVMTPGTSSFFRVAPVDYIDAISLLTGAIYKVTNPRIMIISDKSLYGENYARALETAAAASGITVTSALAIPDNELAASALASKVSSQQTNVVIDTGYSNHLITVANILRGSGYRGVIAATSSVYDPTAIANAPVTATEGVRVAAINVNLEDISPELARKFQQLTGNAPDFFTVPAIDATNVFLTCISAGARSRQDVLACVRKIKATSIDGSPVSFQINGNFEKMSFPVYEIKNKTFQLMEGLYRVSANVNPVVPVVPSSPSSSSDLAVKSITFAKGNFSLLVEDFSTSVKIPAGKESLRLTMDLAAPGATVEASLKNSNGKVSRLAYPVAIEALAGGDYTLTLSIKGPNSKSAEMLSVRLRQLETFSAPKFTVSYQPGGAIKLSFTKSPLASSYDLEIQVNGVFQKVVSNITSGESISGFAPGSTTAISLVANSSSEYVSASKAMSPPLQLKFATATFTCVKGKTVKKVSASAGKCPTGFKAQ